VDHNHPGSSDGLTGHGGPPFPMCSFLRRARAKAVPCIRSPHDTHLHCPRTELK